MNMNSNDKNNFPDWNKATTPQEAVFFEGQTRDFVSLSGAPYYIRITRRCLSPSFDIPFISLYFQCDEAQTYECQIYILMNTQRTVVLNVDWTEASMPELQNILAYVDANKEEWISSADDYPYYIELGLIKNNLQIIDADVFNGNDIFM